jgi:hypothetical protein
MVVRGIILMSWAKERRSDFFYSWFRQTPDEILALCNQFLKEYDTQKKDSFNFQSSMFFSPAKNQWPCSKKAYHRTPIL